MCYLLWKGFKIRTDHIQQRLRMRELGVDWNQRSCGTWRSLLLSLREVLGCQETTSCFSCNSTFCSCWKSPSLGQISQTREQNKFILGAERAQASRNRGTLLPTGRDFCSSILVPQMDRLVGRWAFFHMYIQMCIHQKNLTCCIGLRHNLAVTR